MTGMLWILFLIHFFKYENQVSKVRDQKSTIVNHLVTWNLAGGRLPIVSNIIVENPSDHCLVMATLLFCIFLEKVNTGFT